MRHLTLVGAVFTLAFASSCSCGVVPVDDDGGVAGGSAGSAGGGNAGGGNAGGGSAGGAAGGVGGGDAGGSSAGGAAGGDAGGAAGGAVAGGAAGGAVAGGAAGGAVAGGVAGGAVAGGVAGGAVAGGVAGGAVAGGTAGGAVAGGSAGGAAQTDVYVCGSCPGASMSNPGTQNRPVDTISRGIQLAVMNNLGRVFVASRYGGVIMSYSEDVTVAEGHSLDGRWSVTGTNGNFTWARSAPRTQLRNTAASGLKFPPGITGATVVDGFSITKAGAGLMGGRIAGITVNAGAPLVRDFDIDAPAISIGSATDAIGIDVIGSSTSIGGPSFQGGNTGPSTVTAGTGTTSSIALAVAAHRVTVNNVDLTGEGAGQLSAGVVLVNGSGSTFNRGTYTAGAAATCAGFSATGESGGVRVEGVTATGCPRVPNILNPPRFGAGVLFDGCPPLGVGGAAPIVRNVIATGGVVGGSNSLAVGGASTDGCGVRFEGTTPGAAVFTGTTQGGGGLGAGPETTIGIACSFAGLRNQNGADARCSVAGVTAVGGAAGATNSIGLLCDGTCANQPGSCRGSCEEVVNNTFSAGSGVSMVHVLVRHSSPGVRQNFIGAGSTAVTCGNNAAVSGLTIQGSASTVVNNLIVAGQCLTSIGVAHVLALRSDGSTPSPTFHSNTIVSHPVTGGGTSVLTSLGVNLTGPAGSASALVGGSWRNNIIFAGSSQGAGSRSIAFREDGPGVDPSFLTNNLFFAPGGGTPTTPALYFDEGATTLTTAMAVNLLMGAAGNLAGDPRFQNAGNGNYSLDGNSPAREAGTTMGAPAQDLIRAPRPNPTNTPPDIGCYEVP
ncbi:MAG: hypothetical protein JNJ54_30970 [Myxococcaceae bacterium]|nr:hypothetical protein [Myxococcaceae bacterium]